MQSLKARHRLGTWLMVTAPLGIVVFVVATVHALKSNPDLLPGYLGVVNPIALSYAWGAFWFGLYLKVIGKWASFYFYLAGVGVFMVVFYRIFLLFVE